MPTKLLWTSRDWAAAVAELPVRGPLPCRTVLVPRERIAHALRRELILQERHDVLTGTRFLFTAAAALEVLRVISDGFEPGEEELRATRLLALFRSDLRLNHFSIDLLRSKPGWDEAFAQTISDLEGAGFRPEDLDIPGAPVQVKDVIEIWRALDESAGRSWTIQRIYLEAAVALERSPELWPFQGAVLAVAGTDVTAAMARFMKAIPDATIGVLTSRPIRRRYVERMEELLGKELGDALRSAEAPRGQESERDLLASYLFEPPVILADPDRPRSGGADGTVALEEYAGVEDELEATANWVSRQVIEGIPLEEIAVLVPSADPLAGFVADRLRGLPWHEGSFPVHVAGGLPLSDSAAGARALSVVRALRTYLSVEAMTDVLPVLRLKDHAAMHLSRGAAADLLWSLGIVGGNPAHPEGSLEWSLRAEKRETELAQQLETARAIEDTADVDSSRAIRDIERRLTDLGGLRPALDALVELARSIVYNTALSSFWPALRAFLDEWLLQPGEGLRVQNVLDEQLGKIGKESTCGSLAGEDATRIIEHAILSTRIAVGRFGEPAVYVGSIHGAVGLAFTAVRIIGLAEGHFPSISGEDAVIPDMLRERIARAGANPSKRLVTASDRALQDLHALDCVVRDAKRRIVLSFPRLDVERSQREPSSVILEAAAALARSNRASGDQNAVIPDRNALVRDAFIPARTEAVCFRRGTPLGEAAWHDGVAEGVLGIPQQWRGVQSLDLDRIEQLCDDTPGVMDGFIGAEADNIVVPGVSSDNPLSPSGFQILLTCPHAFLLQRLLGFEEPAAPPPRREIGQPMYGQLFHAVAAEFYGHNGDSFGRRKGKLADWMAIADQIVDQAFDKLLNEYPLVGEAVRQQQRDRLRRDIRDLLEYDWISAKERRFIATEQIFGRPTPVAFHVGKTLVYLRGRIDRIDVEGETALIRDLKTGRAYPRLGKYKDPAPERDIQIALYGLIANILAEEWNIPRHIAATYAYFGPKGHGERSFREDFHQTLEPAALQWIEVAARLLTERCFPRTPNASDCQYCCFHPVCGDHAYERASELLGNAGGVLGDFAGVKGMESGESED